MVIVLRSILAINLFFILLLLDNCFAHQQPSFNDATQQKPLRSAQGVDPHQQQQGQAQQFGGEQAKDEGHIKEHLEGKVDPTSNMTPEQLQFHYFNMHDLDKNSRLDGVELIKAITHFHQENPQQASQHGAPPALPTEAELEVMIDSILREDDFDKDGFIDYGEFLRAQKQREEQAKQYQQQQNAPPPPKH